MGFFDQLKKSEGGYIFISHSHADIVKIREIRNGLEQAGFEPLCFYLKCLSDDSEIEDLIKREIDAREWFVFADSENSRKSKWVTMEREYITRTDKKKIITVDLADGEAILKAIDKITRNLRIFISYSNDDHAIARKIKNKLEEKDYLVFFAPESIPPGSDYVSVVQTAVLQASQEGSVLALISPSALKSHWMMKEIELAVVAGGNVIPVLVGDVELDLKYKFLLSRFPMLHLSEHPTDEEIEALVDRMGRNIVG